MVTLTFGTYPRTRKITIETNKPIRDVTTGDIIFLGKKEMFGKASYEIDLPATDAENISPRGFTYQITLDGEEAKSVGLPTLTPIVDFDQLAPVETVAGGAWFPPLAQGVQGKPGPRGLKGDPGPSTAEALDAANRAKASELAAAGFLDTFQAPTKGQLDSIMGGNTAGLVTSVTAKVNRVDLVLNIKDFGAIGDGVANDSPAFTAALAAAKNAIAAGSGAEVFAPAGKYRLVTGLVVPSFAVLTGAGQKATQLIGVGGITVITLSTGSVMRHVHVRGDMTAGSIGMGCADGSSHWSVEKVWIFNLATGARLAETYIDSFSEVVIAGCTTGVLIAGGSVNALNYRGGEIQYCVDGVVIENTAGQTSTNLNFIGVTIEGHSGYAVKGIGTHYGLSIRDCYFEANTLGNVLQSGIARGMSVEGCTFVGASAFSIKLEAGVDYQISGNTFNLTAGAGVKSILAAAIVNRVTVARNFYLAGQEFVPATDYLGSGLLHLDRQIEFPKATTATASLTIPLGMAPSTPRHGDMWTTAAGLFVRIGATTVGPLS